MSCHGSVLSSHGSHRPRPRSVPVRLSALSSRFLYGLTVMMALLSVDSFINSSQVPVVREYCWESFNASCPSGQMILMTRARYGRMAVGRCITRDYSMGCFSDVITYADRKCSGRQACEIAIPDTNLHKKQPCADDLMAYMEASYDCVPVATGSSSCSSHRTVTLRKPTGYLASSVTAATGVGSPSCPWTIHVPRGQTVNLTLFDFNIAPLIPSDISLDGTANKVKKKKNQITRSDASCQMYAIIREKGQRDRNVCPGGQRKHIVFASKTNIIQVQMMIPRGTPHHGLFAIKYEAVGCPDFPSPSHGTAIRTGEHLERLTIYCNTTGEMRHLVCSDTKWIGEIKNCSQSSVNMPITAENDKPFPYGLVVAIVIGVVLGIALGVILLTVVMICQRRLHQKKRSKNGIFFSGTSQSSVTRMDCMSKHANRTHCTESAAGNGAGNGAGVIRTGQYGYAHVWELQQLKGSNSSPDVIDLDHRDSTSGTGILCGDPLVIYERNPNSTTRIMHGPRTKDCPAYESSLNSTGGAEEQPPFYNEYSTDQASVLHVVCQHQQQAQQCRDCKQLDNSTSDSAHAAHIAHPAQNTCS